MPPCRGPRGRGKGAENRELGGGPGSQLRSGVTAGLADLFFFFNQGMVSAMGEGMGTQINKTLGAKSWGTQIGSFIPIYTSSLGSYQVLFLKQFHHLETEQGMAGKISYGNV